MAATEPVEPSVLAQLVEISSVRVEELCDDLANDYESSQRGFVLARVAGGYRFQTDPSMAPYVERFVLEAQHVRLSGAALETLAIVAYKQPVSRARVSAIRGVNVDGVMRTLLTRGLVEEAGRDGEHGATLYRTTTYFLERIGVSSVDELPELAPYLPNMEDLEDELAELTGLAQTSAHSSDQHPTETSSETPIQTSSEDHT